MAAMGLYLPSSGVRNEKETPPRSSIVTLPPSATAMMQRATSLALLVALLAHGLGLGLAQQQQVCACAATSVFSGAFDHSGWLRARRLRHHGSWLRGLRLVRHAGPDLCRGLRRRL